MLDSCCVPVVPYCVNGKYWLCVECEQEEKHDGEHSDLCTSNHTWPHSLHKTMHDLTLIEELNKKVMSRSVKDWDVHPETEVNMRLQ